MRQTKTTINNENALIQQAKDSFLIGDFAGAEKILKGLIKTNPANEEVHFELGKLYFAQKEYLPSIKELEKTISLNKGHVFAHMLLGKYYMMQKENEKALCELKLALKEDKNNSSIYRDIGILYYEMKDYKLAVANLEKASESGHAAGSSYELAKAYKDSGSYEKAKGLLRKAYKKDPKDTSVNFRLGVLCRELGEKELALKYFGKTNDVTAPKDQRFFNNLVLNETEISKKKRSLVSKPMVLGITLSNRCNIRCKMCRVWRQPWEMPDSIIDEMVELFPYLNQIHWLGGEPFYHKRFEELFDKAAVNPNLRQIIVTNGLFVDDKWAKKLLNNNVEIIFSIDGAAKKSYETIREGASFKRLIESINAINKQRTPEVVSRSKMKMILQVTIIKSNYRELEDFVEFAHKYKFDSLNITPVRYFDEEENIFFANNEKALKYIESRLPAVFKKAKKYGLRVLNILPKFEPGKNLLTKEPKAKSKKVLSKGDVMCYWPWKSMFILNYGNVKPYGYCEQHLGNVTENTLKEIWNGALAGKYRGKLSKNKCSDWCSARCTSGVMPEENLKINYSGLTSGV